MGQRWISVHGHAITAMTPGQQTRRRRLSFGVSLTQRVRDIPTDRMDTRAYTDEESMTVVLETATEVIESLDTFAALEQVMVSSYQLSKQFIFRSMNLDPIHLYPSDFTTRAGNDKEELYDKIAGYRMTAMFDSPEYQLTVNPLECQEDV